MDTFAAIRKRAGSMSMSDSLSNFGAGTKSLFSTIATKTNEIVNVADPSQLVGQQQQPDQAGGMRQQQGGIKKAVSISDVSEQQMGGRGGGFYEEANNNYRGGQMNRQMSQQAPQMGQDFRNVTSAMNAMIDSDPIPAQQQSGFSTPQPQRQGYSSVANRQQRVGAQQQQQQVPQPSPQQQPQFSPQVQQFRQQLQSPQPQQPQQQMRQQMPQQQNAEIIQQKPQPQQQQGSNASPGIGGFLGGLKTSVGGIIPNMNKDQPAEQQSQPQNQQVAAAQQPPQQQQQQQQGGLMGGLFGGLKNAVKADDGLMGQFKTFVKDNEIVSTLKEGTGEVVGQFKSAVDVGSKQQQQQQPQQQAQQPEVIPPEASLLGKVHREQPVTPYVQQQEQPRNQQQYQQQQPQPQQPGGDYLLQKAVPQQQNVRMMNPQQQHNEDYPVNQGQGRGQPMAGGRGGQMTRPQMQQQQQRMQQPGAAGRGVPPQQMQAQGRGRAVPASNPVGQQQQMMQQQQQAMAMQQQQQHLSAMAMDDTGSLSDAALDTGDTASEDSSYSSSPHKAAAIRDQYFATQQDPSIPVQQGPKIRPGKQQPQQLQQQNLSTQSSPKVQHNNRVQQPVQQQQQQQPPQPEPATAGFDYTAKYQQKVAAVKQQAVPMKQQDLSIETGVQDLHPMGPNGNRAAQQAGNRRPVSQQIDHMEIASTGSNVSESVHMEPVGPIAPAGGRGRGMPAQQASQVTRIQSNAGRGIPAANLMEAVVDPSSESLALSARNRVPQQQQQQQQPQSMVQHPPPDYSADSLSMNKPGMRTPQQFENVPEPAAETATNFAAGNRQRHPTQQQAAPKPTGPGNGMGRGMVVVETQQSAQQDNIPMSLSTPKGAASTGRQTPVATVAAASVDYSSPNNMAVKRTGSNSNREAVPATPPPASPAFKTGQDQVDLSMGVRRKSTSSEVPPAPVPAIVQPQTQPQPQPPAETEGVLNLSSGPKKRPQQSPVPSGAQSTTAPSSCFSSSDNLFDQSVSDEIRQIGLFIEDFVKRVFEEGSIVEEVETEFVENAFCQNGYHRKLFVRTIESKRGDRRTLPPVVFFRLVRLFTSSLLSVGDLADFVTARLLMNMTFTFRCELPNHVAAGDSSSSLKTDSTPDHQFYRIWLYDFVKGSPIFRSEKFWEEVAISVTSANAGSGRNRGRSTDPNFIFGQLSGLCRNMRSLGLERDFVHSFVRKNAAVDFTDEQVYELLDNAEPWPATS